MSVGSERPQVSADSAPAARRRTLTEALRHAGPEALAELLRLRPDLCRPVPEELAELSARATSTPSVARALDDLNAWQLLVAEGLASLPDPATVADLSALLDHHIGDCTTAVAALRARALVWGRDDQLHLVRAVRDQFGSYPGGLAPPSSRELAPEEIATLLAECDRSVDPVIERLLWSPAGVVADAERVVERSTARTPVEQLLARRLLRPLTSDTVLLPREVALYARAGRFAAEPVPADPPTVTAHPGRRLNLVDRAGAGAAFGLVHDIENTVRSLEDTPVRLLRDGGVPHRDLGALAGELGTDRAHATFVLEWAAAAGLVAAGDRGRLLPTGTYDRWARREAPARWRTVAAAWLGCDRSLVRAGEPGAHALGPEGRSPRAPTIRTLLVTLAAGLGAGVAVDLAELAAAATWHRPALFGPGSAPAPQLAAATWREADWLGLVSLGTTTSLLVALLAVDQPFPAAMTELFPDPVDRIVIQSDLTAVAQGPLPHGLAGDLRLLADQESRGHAAVFRFQPSSLRRAFDAGWSAADIHGWLAQHSTTGVPQPLAYLVDDVARRRGSVRVGPATSILRVDDEAQVTTMLRHPEAAQLGLRAVAPGVLVAAAEAEEVIRFVRQVGLDPTAEDHRGQTLTTPEPQRATGPKADRPAAVDVERLAERLLGSPRAPAESSPAVTETVDRQVRAVDRASAQVLQIPLARISAVSPRHAPPLD